MKLSKVAFYILLSLFVSKGEIVAQTDFGPGDIMFTGFNSDNPDAFSIVFLIDAVANTQIFITDRGWDNSIGDGFRIDNTGEGTISFTFPNAYSCGSEFIISYITATNTWEVRDGAGVLVGNAVIQAGGDINGPELGCVGVLCPDGDQLFIYQSPEPTPTNQTSFVTGIHINNVGWDADNNLDQNSEKPTALSDFQTVTFSFEPDNAKYDCSPNVGSGDYLMNEITNANEAGLITPPATDNWNTSDNIISLTTPCNFCCMAYDISAPELVSASQMFQITITGTLPAGQSWQLFTAGCGVGSPIQTTMTNSFTVTAPGTEGTVTYYIRPSGLPCSGSCVAISVCVENTPLAYCTNCNGDPDVCGDCLMPDIYDNPDLDSGCYEIKMIFILDRSGSIGANSEDVENGVLAFLDALNGQDIDMALIDFSGTARLVTTTGYTPINNLLINQIDGYFNSTPFNGFLYNPVGGGTNWHDAMIKADALPSADIIMFFTDGVPTSWNTNNQDCGNGATTQLPEILNPVKIANQFKAEDTHMFMLGVGAGIDEYNLALMSGFTEYDSTINTIGTSDYSIGNFEDLAEDLSAFVSELCNTPLELEKLVYGAVCDGEQQFAFIIHNPGTESAATSVEVTDTFPSGYTNITYNGSPFVKVCIGAGCEPQGDTIPDNAFIWTTNSVAPGEYDTLILSATVLGSGLYTNIAWAEGSNTALISDTVTSPNFVDDLDPVITCPPNVIINCGTSTLPASTGVATAVDPDGSSPVITYADVTVAGTCPILYLINRTWTALDGCNNLDNCLQTITIHDTVPIITACAITRNIVGCSNSVITGPVFSTTTAASSEAVFENATNQGNASDLCGITSVTYIDVAGGTCPINVSRTWTITDGCGYTATCVQAINVNDVVPPSISSCAVTRNIEGCNTTAITGPSYSTTTAASSEAVFENATNQGNVTDVCAISAVTYIDVAAGTCPTVVTRKWTVTDACGNTATCNQIINVDDNVLPTIATCPVTRNIEGCGTSSITGPAYSTTTATSTEAVFENATNQGSTSDACNITLVNYIDVASGTCPTVVTRKWTVSDACGNTATCNQTINVDDTASPTITACAVTRNVQGCNTSAITGPVYSTTTATSTEAVFENGTNQGNISDACGITSVMYIDVASGSCPTVVTRTWTLTDACGNTSSCNQTINLDDTAAPTITTCAVTRNIEGCNTSVITGPPFSTTSATSSEAVFESAPNLGNISDLCGITSVTYIDVASSSCPTVVTRTWSITDACANTSTCNQTINVDDTVNPSIAACAVTRNIEGCNTSAITDPVFSATTATSSEAVFENATNQGNASDICGITSVTYIDVTSGSCPTVVTRKWTVSDVCGNTATCNQTINVNDTGFPLINTCAVTRNIEGCNTAAITGPSYSTTTASSTEAVFENATNQGNTSDACGISSVTYIDVAAGTCPTVVTRKWTVSDACGHTATCNQTINVNDSVFPVIGTCPVTRNIEGCNTTAITGPAFSTTTASSTEVVFENATNQGNTSDACGISSVTYIDVAAGTCPTVVTRKWTVSDACGHTATCNQTINVDDNIAPAITTCAVTRNIEGCNTAAITGPSFSTTSTASTEVVFENATNLGNVSDVCGITSVTYIDVASGTCPTVVTRTWTINDACGNTSTCNQIINVDDNITPAITTCAVTRNIEGCNTTAITGPSYSTTTAASTEAVFENATNQGVTSDACGITSVTYIDVAAGTCPTVVTRKWTVSDACGNTTTCNQTINVDDTAPPVIATCPVTRNFEGCNTSVITGPPYSATSASSTETQFENANNQGSVSDICGITSVTYIDVTSGTCPIVVTRKWTVSDACGNTATCNQTINVDDNTNPTITTCAVTRNIEGCNTAAITGPSYSTTTAASTEVVFENATNQGSTSDACGITSVTYIDVAAGTCPTVVTRKWTVSDACGNTTTCNQTINVDDTVLPTISACAVTRNIEGCNTSSITGPPFSSTSAASSEAVFENTTNQGNISDVCGITSVTYIDVATGTCPTVVTRTWTISDACANVSTCNQTINVDDTTNPVLTCPANVTIQCTASTAPSNTGNGSATDNCVASPVVTYSDVTTASSTCPQEYTITRTWSTSDNCGNSSSCVQVITIDDSVAPMITCPSNTTIECIENTTPSNTGSATASDNCDASPSVTHADVTSSIPGTNSYLIQRTWTSTDDCGNVSSCVQSITVVNPLNPEILGAPFDTICSGMSVAFQAMDQGINPITYQWTFGSGSSPTSATGIGPHNVTYTYNGSNGTTGAWVILTVSTPGCASETDTVSNIHVNAIPNTAITVTPPGNPCVLQNKTFQPTSPQMPGFTYNWNFGAGASIPSASGYGPHTVEYFTSGTKTVQLFVFSNEAGASCGDTGSVTFTVLLCPGNITGRVYKVDSTGITGIASVNLRLYADQNLDGIQDTTAAIRSVFTNAQGNYSMAALTPGYYVIYETQPTGYFSLYDEDATEDYDSLSNLIPNNNILPVTVEPSEIDSNNYFAEVSAPGIITGYVFQDFDNNMMPIPIEGLQGVTVKLHRDNDQNGKADPGGLVSTTTSSSIGYYTFGGMAVGNYVITEQTPAGFNNVKDYDWSEDSDNVPNTNMTNDTLPVTLLNAESDDDNFFIEISPCSKIVTNVNDNGPGSLRYMIDCAGNNDTITFHPILQNQTLHLNTDKIEINKDLHILSSLTPRLMIYSDVIGAFKIFSGKTVEFKNLNFTSGLSGANGAAFENYGHLTLWDNIIYRNPLLPTNQYLIFNGSPGMITAKGSIQIDSN